MTIREGDKVEFTEADIMALADKDERVAYDDGAFEEPVSQGIAQGALAKIRGEK